MEKIEKVYLKPEERAAYWWIKIIKMKLDEVSNKLYLPTHDEILFSNIFNEYTDIEWRELYLKLKEELRKDCLSSKKAFVQNTDKSRHDKLNEELELITGRSIPDIRLADINHKDASIFITPSDCKIRFNSTLTKIDLPDKENPEYIIDGDLDSYNFFGLLIATMLMVNDDDVTINSFEHFKKHFCNYYMLDNNIDEKDKTRLLDQFDYYFGLASDKGYINGKCYDDGYFTLTKKSLILNHIDISFDEDTFNKAIEYSSYIFNPQSREKVRKLGIKEYKKRS